MFFYTLRLTAFEYLIYVIYLPGLLPLQMDQKTYIKEKCGAYRAMVKAEAKYIEAKENYYEVKQKLKAPIEISSATYD